MRRKIIAVHNADAFKDQRSRLIGKTGRFRRSHCHIDSNVPEHGYESGDFIFDHPVKQPTGRKVSSYYFYAISTLPYEKEGKHGLRTTEDDSRSV